MKKNIEILIKISLGLTLFVPLLVMPSTFIFPFIVPKALVFRSLLVIATCGYLLLFYYGKTKRIALDAVSIAVLVFFSSLTISTFVGEGWHRSFWDNHERMLGLFTLFHFVAYYYVCRQMFSEWKDWVVYARWFILAASAVMMVGILQRLQPDLLINRGALRVASTLGNAIYVGGYGVFLVCLGLITFFHEKSKNWKYYALAGTALGLIGLIISGTRGSFIGLCLGLGVLAIVYLIKHWGNKKVRFAISGVLIAGLLGAIGLFVFRDSSVVNAIPLLKRLTMIDFANLGTNTRIMAWQVGIEAWRDHMIFGWGPNNYFYAFNEYYNPDFLLHSWAETWFDSAHNVVINTLTTQGIVGVLSYVGLFVAAAYQLIRGYKNGKISVHFVAVGLMFLTAHFVHNLFVFENITSYIYFMFFLAMVSTAARTEPIRTVDAGKTLSLGTVGIVAGVCFIIINLTNIQPAKANMAILEVMRNMSNAQANVITEYEDATKIRTPHVDDIRYDYGRAAKSRIIQLNDAGLREKAITLGDFVLQELEKNVMLLPKDPRSLILQAEISIVLAEMERDIARMTYAEGKARRALEISPDRQQLEFLWASILVTTNRSEEAVQVIDAAIAKAPTVQEGYWRKAVMLLQLGELELANEEIDRAEKLGIHFKGDGALAVQQIRAAAANQPTVEILQ
ncbi:MAG: hypothetical protein HOE53_03595 [Candidatus Magasanikbacteria bacterium]|jgi:O-antigen ligase|nr:hypothetical protein [Candidatus Magasanikbacteria bacterium]